MLESRDGSENVITQSVHGDYDADGDTDSGDHTSLVSRYGMACGSTARVQITSVTHVPERV